MKPSLAPDSAFAYPDDVEWFHVSHALGDRFERQALATLSGDAAKALDRFARDATDLSDRFTVDRPAEFDDYAADPRVRAAYAIFFAPQTWVRTRIALAEVVEARGRRLGSDGSISILDLGAGLGAAGWGAAQWAIAGGHAHRVRLAAVDRSRESLADFEAALAACPESARGITVTTQRADIGDLASLPNALRGPFDLVVVSFALNEVFPPGDDDRARAWIEEVAARLTPSGVLLVLEPALRSTAARLRDLVRPIADAGRLHVLAPDLHGRIAPPHPEERFVDHEVRRWRMPPSVRRLNRVLRRSLDEVTFSFVALSGTSSPSFAPSPPRVRLTSPFARLKGRRAFTALDASGARITFDLLERTVDDASRDAVLAIERGDHVEILESRALREPGWSRLASPASLRVVWHPV